MRHYRQSVDFLRREGLPAGPGLLFRQAMRRSGIEAIVNAEAIKSIETVAKKIEPPADQDEAAAA
jgi:hypothetical protein